MISNYHRVEIVHTSNRLSEMEGSGCFGVGANGGDVREHLYSTATAITRSTFPRQHQQPKGLSILQLDIHLT
jgi:hypothetical protein